MKYLLLIYDTEKRWTNLSKDEVDADVRAYSAFSREIAANTLGGHALQPTNQAKTVRVRDGNQLLTDGPFAETKEQLAGYYLVEAATIDEAVAIAAKIPWARTGSIEVRPILKFTYDEIVASKSAANLSPAEMERARSHVQQTRGALLAALAGLSEPQWNFKPAPDRWSAAEILEHVVVIQEAVLGPLRQLLANSPATVSRDTEIVDRIIVEQFPDRTAKLSAPATALPSGRWAPPDALERFSNNCARLIDVLESTLDLRQRAAEAPPLRAISNGAYTMMDGYQWLLAASAHAGRHTKQILELKAGAGFPAA